MPTLVATCRFAVSVSLPRVQGLVWAVVDGGLGLVGYVGKLFGVADPTARRGSDVDAAHDFGGACAADVDLLWIMLAFEGLPGLVVLELSPGHLRTVEGGDHCIGESKLLEVGSTVIASS